MSQASFRPRRAERTSATTAPHVTMSCANAMAWQRKPAPEVAAEYAQAAAKSPGNEKVLNQLYRYSALQSTFGANMLALNGGRPELLDLKAIIAAFIDFREEVITRRTAFELRKRR